MNSKKILPCGTLAVGSLIALTGLGFTVMYVFEAIIARIGDPDQSLLFWYLPILFIGLFGILVGAGIGTWGTIRFRNIQQKENNPDN